MNRTISLLAAVILTVGLPIIALAQNDPASSDLDVPVVDTNTEDPDGGIIDDISTVLPGLEEPLVLPGTEEDTAIGDNTVIDNESGAEVNAQVDVEVESDSVPIQLGTTAGWIVAALVVLGAVYWLFQGVRR